MPAELEGKEIIIKAKVGQQDRLYGSITSADIAAGLESSLKAVVDKRKIELAEPIRQLAAMKCPLNWVKISPPKSK